MQSNSSLTVLLSCQHSTTYADSDAASVISCSNSLASSLDIIPPSVCSSSEASSFVCKYIYSKFFSYHFVHVFSQILSGSCQHVFFIQHPFPVRARVKQFPHMRPVHLTQFKANPQYRPSSTESLFTHLVIPSLPNPVSTLYAPSISKLPDTFIPRLKTTAICIILLHL